MRYDAKLLPILEQCLISEQLGIDFKQVEFVPFCPEVGIGLGVPRAKIQLVRNKNKQICVLGVEDHTWDLTERLKSYANDFLQLYPDINYYVVKSKSPSCGYQSTPLFERSGQKVVQIAVSSGIFVKTILEYKPQLMIVDETC